jgi:hypothetical protein
VLVWARSLRLKQGARRSRFGLLRCPSRSGIGKGARNRLTAEKGDHGGLSCAPNKGFVILLGAPYPIRTPVGPRGVRLGWVAGAAGEVHHRRGLVFAFTMGSMAVSDLLHHRSGGHDAQSGSAVRHVDCALVHGAIHRRVARTLVLVAAKSAPLRHDRTRGRRRGNNRIPGNIGLGSGL